MPLDRIRQHSSSIVPLDHNGFGLSANPDPVVPVVRLGDLRCRPMAQVLFTTS
jgi:hypothetical protein